VFYIAVYLRHQILSCNIEEVQFLYLISLPKCSHWYEMLTISCYLVSAYGLPLCPSLRPSYPCDLCCPVSVVAARRVLRSVARGEVLVPRARLAIMQRRVFSVVDPSTRNDLPFELRSLPMAHRSKFYISLKSFFFVRDWAGSASECYISLQNE